jgi:hypothetical protein
MYCAASNRLLEGVKIAARDIQRGASLLLTSPDERRQAFPASPAALGCAVLILMLSTKIVSSQSFHPIRCGDGRIDTIIDDFDSPSFQIFKNPPWTSDPILSIVAGCRGNALRIDYDLTSGNWIVLQRSLTPKNLAAFTHLRLAVRGSNINSHDNIEVKLRDGSNRLLAVILRSTTDVPVWRPLYIDLREFGTLDLTNITAFELAIVRCNGCEVFDNPSQPPPSEEHKGALVLDEFAAVNLKPGARNRIVETVFEKIPPNPTLLGTAAKALLDKVASSGPGMGFVPAWFAEASPNFNSYAQAEALLVFIYEYERTGNIAYRDAARNLAARLISLQIPLSRRHVGAWYTGYTINGLTLRPPDRALQPIACDGNEMAVSDIDTCEWAGNVGWVLIALGKLQRSGFYHDPAALKDALDRGAAWIVRQPGERGNAAGLATLGVEGNISSYFGLLNANRKLDARLMGDAIFQCGWDPVERRMKPGICPWDFATALDVSGSWGVRLLRSIFKIHEAFDSQGYTASILPITSFDGRISGYGDIAGPYTPVVEFTAQAGAAGIRSAEFVMQQMYLLQQPSGAFPGAPDHWYGGQLSPWSTTMPGVSPTAWVYFASNCDPLVRKVGLIWMHDVTRQAVLWHMDCAQGNQRQSWDWLRPSENGVPGWSVVGTGNFNGDGCPDVVWMNDVTRQAVVWYMGDVSCNVRQSWDWLRPSENGVPGWSVVGTGNFNGGGCPDVVWMNDVTRQAVVWNMGNVSCNVRQSWQWLSPSEGGVPGWSVTGAGDFSRDGCPDVVWMNDITRQAVVWYMGGPSCGVRQSWEWISAGGIPGWRVTTGGDFHGAGNTDVIWVNDITRQAVMWYLNGPGTNGDHEWAWISPTEGGLPQWRPFVVQ